MTVLQLVDEDETERRGEEDDPRNLFDFFRVPFFGRLYPLADDRSELFLAVLICQRVQTYIEAFRTWHKRINFLTVN